ncbi:MAG TPA: hypothetical protein VH256_04615, partial [Thermoleophilaceae bacterium]|nr:hypothetical protein [Thermoleophilaceae bacterium]
MSATGWAWLVLAFPLAGAIVISLGWRAIPGRLAGWIASGMILGSFACAIAATLKMQDVAPGARHASSTLFDYAHSAGLNIGLSVYVDPLSLFMALVVSGVSFLIHVYSVSYMTSDRGFNRFFAYLNFFV